MMFIGPLHYYAGFSRVNTYAKCIIFFIVADIAFLASACRQNDRQCELCTILLLSLVRKGGLRNMGLVQMPKFRLYISLVRRARLTSVSHLTLSGYGVRFRLGVVRMHIDVYIMSCLYIINKFRGPIYAVSCIIIGTI